MVYLETDSYIHLLEMLNLKGCNTSTKIGFWSNSKWMWHDMHNKHVYGCEIIWRAQYVA